MIATTIHFLPWKQKFDSGSAKADDGKTLIPQYIELLFEWIYSILQQHDLSMRQLNLKADHDNTIMALNDMVEALVRADIEATELFDVWQNSQEIYNQSLAGIQAATNNVQSTAALLEDAECTLDNGKLHMKKWKEELEALEIEWQTVPSMCMLLGYAARYMGRPEDCNWA